MNIKEQVLSIEQVQELQELGFDVKKYSSACIIGAKDRNKYIVDRRLVETEVIEYHETMTIGDIIEVLPGKIEEFILNINRKYVAYDSKTTNLFYAYRYRFIDSLFDCLVWCIKQKHIELKINNKNKYNNGIKRTSIKFITIIRTL